MVGLRIKIDNSYYIGKYQFYLNKRFGHNLSSEIFSEDMREFELNLMLKPKDDPYWIRKYLFKNHTLPYKKYNRTRFQNFLWKIPMCLFMASRYDEISTIELLYSQGELTITRKNVYHRKEKGIQNLPKTNEEVLFKGELDIEKIEKFIDDYLDRGYTEKYGRII